MQTTLLGLGIAIILALVAALVGPLLIDWAGHRSLFETEASRLLGDEVRVNGAIEARLLPSPQVTLHDIEIGKGNVRAGTLGFELALGPLMRGEWHASEVHIVRPQLQLGLDRAGHLQTPNLALDFSPDTLSIEHLSIEDGKIVLGDAANGAAATLEGFWFNGDARSLLGPFKGEGATTVAGELYPFRLAGGRYGNDGLKLHLNIDPVSQPLSIETDGMLTLTAGQPRFDGTLNLTRPVGIRSRSSAELMQPWRVSGKVKASPASALMQQLEFQYGAEEQGLKLTGVAEFRFGRQPRFDGVLSGRQIDLDRALAGEGGSRPPPAAAIRQIMQLAGGAFRPAVPVQIGLGIDQVALGGSTVANLRGDISSDANGWNLERFEFRAPGFTQVRLSGHLAIDRDSVNFSGPAEVDAGDPKILAAWLEGRGNPTTGEARPLNLRGDVVLGSDRIAVERLKASFDRKDISGRFAYFFAGDGRPAKLDAALDAPELDIDAGLGFGKALFSGSNLERPYDMSIAANVGRAMIGGLEARDVSAKLQMDGSGLQIERFSVANLGGAALSASGRITIAPPSPQGSIRVDLDAPDAAPVMALVARFAPKTAQELQSRAAALAPAKLRAQFALEGAAPSTTARLALDGSLGKVRIALNGQARADPVALRAGDMTFDGKLEADDGKALVSVLGLTDVVNVSVGPGLATLKASGPARGEWRLDGKLSAAGLEASVAGTSSPLADDSSAFLHVVIVRADAAPLRGAGRSKLALPVAFAGNISLAGDQLTVSDINASVSGAKLRGKIGVTRSLPHRLQGEINADSIDAVGLLAASIGMPASDGGNAAWTWSTEPFAGGVFGDYAGQVALKVRRVDFSPRLVAREFRATLQLGKQELVINDASGILGGGRLAGQLQFRSSDDGLNLKAQVSVHRMEAATLLAFGARPPVSGILDISCDLEGSGMSPVALVGSLQGSGRMALNDGQFAGLDPRAFDVVARAVDHGLPVETPRVADLLGKAIDGGSLSLKHLEGPLAINVGQVRLDHVSVERKDAALSLAGNLDLTDGSLDARLILSGPDRGSGARPDVFMALKGPVAAPARSIDVSALTAWLALRSVENQARQLREIEEARRLREMENAQRLLQRDMENAQRQRDLENAQRRATMLPKTETAPALPPPLNIRPPPGSRRAVPPEASVRP